MVRRTAFSCFLCLRPISRFIVLFVCLSYRGAGFQWADETVESVRKILPGLVQDPVDMIVSIEAWLDFIALFNRRLQDWHSVHEKLLDEYRHSLGAVTLEDLHLHKEVDLVHYRKDDMVVETPVEKVAISLAYAKEPIVDTQLFKERNDGLRVLELFLPRILVLEVRA